MKVISGFGWDGRPRGAAQNKAAGARLPSTIAQGLRTAYEATLTERLPDNLAMVVERLGPPKPDDPHRR